MTNHNDILISVASWEDRFRLGFERLLNISIPKEAIVFYYKEYTEWTFNNREFVEKLCNTNGINLLFNELSFEDPVNSWKTLYHTINNAELANKRVIVDITTMPRETIWTLFDLLEGVNAIISYLYNKPKDYNEDWLSRDPARPRLVFKLAGEAQLGKPTILLILTGFDPDRTNQLIHFFEPKKCFIGLQTGEDFSNQTMNIAKHKKRFGKDPLIEFFDVDAYLDDYGFKTIETIIKPYLENSNLLLTSLGPKLSAVALYRLHKAYPKTALVYAPSGDFNKEYSHGIGTYTMGRLY